MKASSNAAEQRELAATARRYRRNGYKVSSPRDKTAKPSFLGELAPDLIAERDDDRVVIEVKRTAAVTGANDLVELAERIAGQPGWRFELIAVPSLSNIAEPDLAWAGTELHQLLRQDHTKAAYIIAAAILDNLVAYAAARLGRNPADSSLPALLRDLVVQGVIDETLRQVIANASTRRNALTHGVAIDVPSRADVELLLEVSATLRDEITMAEAPS